MALSARLPLMGVEEAKELMQVVLGSKKADLAIINARLANVYTGELLDNYAVTLKGKWIAYVGKEPHDSIGPDTVVIDAEGMTIIPGLIDGHAHLANIYDSSEFLRYAIKGGTTTIIAETMEAFPMGGYDGVLDYMESYADQPVKVYFTIPAMVSISRTCNGMPVETLKKLLQRDDVLGFGESYWQAVLQEPDQFLPLYNETIRCGKMVEGHSAGASGKKLMAYVAAGVSSCHEPISAEEVRERLRLGLYVMAREGSIRRELDAVSRIKDMNVDLRRLILVTDGVYPKDLLEKGYEEFVLQKAIDCGFDPMEALRMVTLNVAERFALDGILGGIAPGKYADMLVLPDLRTIKAEYVISGGKIAAQKGKVLVEPRKHVYSKASLNSVHLPSELKPEDFSIKINGDILTKKIRIIDQVTDLVTKELTMVMPVIDGEIRADVKQDIIKVAAIDRTHNPGRSFVGLLRGFHMRSGAFATSVAWDTSDIIVVGVSDADMSLAVNRIHALQGGTVVCADGIIIAEFPMPVLGQISDLPMEELSRKMEEIEDAVKGLGVPFANPFLTLCTLTGAAIPYLRICEEGLVNLKDGKTLDLVVSE
ncbi:MAG: adenine deaminase C-terminal domain-containing protein [Syntrophales bacterium]|nr:adenine deaminase C-terminal domain-containing protein [Syntrophales bacterium]